MFVEAMTRFSGWITGTHASQVVQAIGWYVPAVQSTHILAVATVLASAAMLNLRILGCMNRSLSVAALGARFQQPVWIGVAVLVISGLALLLAEPERSLVSQVFQLKMAMLAVAVILTVRQQKAVAAQAAEWEARGAAPAAVKVVALITLVLWVCILFAGRWIAYAQY